MIGNDEKKAIEVAIQEAEDALKGGDKEAIDGAAAKLTEATGPVAQKMYSAQAAEQAAPESGGQETSDADEADDAVDAEFEEVKEDKT